MAHYQLLVMAGAVFQIMPASHFLRQTVNGLQDSLNGFSHTVVAQAFDQIHTFILPARLNQFVLKLKVTAPQPAIPLLKLLIIRCSRKAIIVTGQA